MKRLFKLFCLSLCLLLANDLFGQQKCLTNEKRASSLEFHPELTEKRNALEKNTLEWIAENGASMRLQGVISLPIVVHVLWYENEENISDDQIESQIPVLNENFRKLNANFSNAPAAFQSLASDV